MEMKQLRNYINIRKKPSTIKATDKTIYKIVKDELDRLGHDADLNHIDVSEVTDMSSLFSCANIDLGPTYGDLNTDISQWNVSNVKNMNGMFYECKDFNKDISSWDVSNTQYMSSMFWRCRNFNQDLSQWTVSNVENMQWMFYCCENFSQDLSQWDVSRCKNMNGMFYKCKNFNKDISRWNVSNVKNMNAMFDYCSIKEEFKPKFKK